MPESRTEQMIRWLRANAVDVDRVEYGQVWFVWAGPSPLRAKLQSEQIVEPVLTKGQLD